MKQILKNTLLLFTFVFFTEQAIAQTNVSPPKEFVLNNGEIVKLTDLKGKVVLLDFWYRGCLPCLKATPELIRLQEEFRDDLVIIGINDSDSKEDISDYYSYKKNSYYFSTYKRTKNISKSLRISAFPTFIIINKKGEIIKINEGFNKSSIRKTIKKLIQENQ